MKNNIIIYNQQDKNVLIKHILESYNLNVLCFDGTVPVEEILSSCRPIAFLVRMQSLSIREVNKLIGEIREYVRHIPIIILVSSKEELLSLKHVEDECWDYLNEDILYDIEARFRLILGKNHHDTTYEREQLSENTIFCFYHRELIIHKRVKALSPIETIIMKVLVDHMNIVVKKEELIELCWKSKEYFNNLSYLYHHLTRLRKHLKDDPDLEIETIRNVGYRLVSRKHAEV